MSKIQQRAAEIAAEAEQDGAPAEDVQRVKDQNPAERSETLSILIPIFGQLDFDTDEIKPSSEIAQLKLSKDDLEEITELVHVEFGVLLRDTDITECVTVDELAGLIDRLFVKNLRREAKKNEKPSTLRKPERSA